MKLADRTNDYHVNLVQENVGFKVANSVHMMKILSDSLYSDKIAAVIRELSTNAYDSHVAAGTPDVPFYVEFPESNNDNMTFKIRDYGTGLSKERVFELYTVYGLSDKSNSNDYVGCLGLGSKSPFCYTNIFTTISYYNGMKYVFINATNHRGQPQCNLMHSEETDEPNGLEISFDIHNNGDRLQFISKAKAIYKYFDIKPTTNLKDFAVEKVDFNDSHYHIDENSYSRESSKVIMGQVAYPLVSKHFVQSKEINARQINQITSLVDSGILLKVNVGEVDMDASREALQYNKRTIENIEKKLIHIINEIKKEIQERLNKQECLWDASVKFDDFVKELGVKHLFIKSDFKYKGKNLLEDNIIIDDDISFYRHGYGAGIKKSLGKYVPISKYIVFIENDTKNTGIHSLREYAKLKYHQNSGMRYHSYILIQPHQVGKVRDLFHNNVSNFIKISSFAPTLPKKTKTTGNKKVKDNSLDCVIFKQQPILYYNGRARERWSTVHIDDVDNGIFYYVIVSPSMAICQLHNNAVTRSSSCNFDSLNNYVNSEKIKVYGLTPRRYEKIEDKKNWIPLSVHVKQKLDSYYNDKKNLDKLKYANLKNAYQCFNFLYKYLNQNTEMFKFLHKFKDFKFTDVDNQNSVYISLLSKLQKEEYVFPTVKQEKFEVDKIYPMLPLLGSYSLRNNPKVVAEYINLVNK